jgi:glutathione S-transferase
MVTLYINPNCPFCRKTVEVAKEIGVPLTIKDVHEPANEAELIRLGGQKQMPYMTDDATGKAMYESDDIMAYLHQTYGKDT